MKSMCLAASLSRWQLTQPNWVLTPLLRDADVAGLEEVNLTFKIPEIAVLGWGMNKRAVYHNLNQSLSKIEWAHPTQALSILNWVFALNK